ncbi:MAG: hypothetical protein NZZ41_07870, partial [Candidatus Dojkabacteria bacterium]|nr:hypothetical protein [Candidatus Dojkabacteria bacterium]
MTEKHYSNASFFGSVTLGKKEYQYSLPKERANKPNSVIIDKDGDGQNLTFDTIEQYIDIHAIQELDGVINFINNFNNYTEAGNNLFQNLSDVQGGINDYAGKFIIVNPNAPSNLKKVVYSNHTYNDVINSILDLQNRVSSLESSANGFHGKVEIIPSQRIYTINHEEVNEDTEYPIVSLQIPSSGSNIFIA